MMGSLVSLMATTSTARDRGSVARRKLRPMRPNPLIATRATPSVMGSRRRVSVGSSEEHAAPEKIVRLDQAEVVAVDGSRRGHDAGRVAQASPFDGVADTASVGEMRLCSTALDVLPEGRFGRRRQLVALLFEHPVPDVDQLVDSELGKVEVM